MKIEILRTGKFRDAGGRDIVVDREALARMASSYDPQLHEAPVVVGHPVHDQPAYGWVKRLEAHDDRLLAELGELDPGFVELVRQGRFKTRSVSLYLPGMANHPRSGEGIYLRHVGFLGAQPPAVKGLRPVQFAGDEGDAVAEISVTVTEEAEMAEATPKGQAGEGTGADARRLLRRLVDAGMSLEDISKALDRLGDNASRSAGTLSAILNGEIGNPPESLITALRRISTKSTAEESNMTDTGQDTGGQAAALAERERELEDRARKLAEREAELEAERRRLAREAHVAFAEGLLAEGRIVPADRDIVVALLEVADTAPAEFADGETVFGERLRKWLSSLPKRVEFGERAGGEKHAELSDPETIAERAIAYQTEMKSKGIIVRADEAVRRVVGG